MLRLTLDKQLHNTRVAIDHDGQRLAVADDVVQLLHDIMTARDMRDLDDRERGVHSQLVQSLYHYVSTIHFILAGQFYGVHPFARLTIECVLYACRFRDSEAAFTAWLGRHDRYAKASQQATTKGETVGHDAFFTLDRDCWQGLARNHFRHRLLLTSAAEVMKRMPRHEVMIDYLSKRYDEAIAYGAHPNVMHFVEASTVGPDGRSALSMVSSSMEKYRHNLASTVALGQTITGVVVALLPDEARTQGAAERLQALDRRRTAVGFD